MSVKNIILIAPDIPLLFCVCVSVGWNYPGHSSPHPDATPDPGFAVVVLASLLHCGRFSQSILGFLKEVSALAQ